MGEAHIGFRGHLLGHFLPRPQLAHGQWKPESLVGRTVKRAVQILKYRTFFPLFLGTLSEHAMVFLICFVMMSSLGLGDMY